MSSLTILRSAPVAKAAAVSASARSSAARAAVAAPMRLGASGFHGVCFGPQRVAMTASRPAASRQATATVVLASADAPTGSMSAADTSRTIVEVGKSATLCTVNEDGTPLGTYAGYVLGDDGMPVLRLRAAATHTGNVKRDAKCSLFIQSKTIAGAAMSRVTLIGELEAVAEAEVDKVAELYAARHAGAKGVDAPQDEDLFYRLNVDRALFVGAYSGAAEEVSGAELAAAKADILKDCQVELLKEINERRLEDVVRFATRAGMDTADLLDVQMTHLDSLGFDLSCVSTSREVTEVRVPFPRAVIDERDARSALTMMAQETWEMERDYIPKAEEAAA